MADQPHILIIDDERQFIDIFSSKLSAAGFKVEAALSGAEGIEKARTMKPDLILLDVKMPGMSGAETLLKIQEDEALKNTKVVFLTSLSDPRAGLQEHQAADVKFSSDFGADYLRKTDDLELIVDRVKSLLPSAHGDALGGAVNAGGGVASTP